MTSAEVVIEERLADLRMEVPRLQGGQTALVSPGSGESAPSRRRRGRPLASEAGHRARTAARTRRDSRRRDAELVELGDADLRTSAQAAAA